MCPPRTALKVKPQTSKRVKTMELNECVMNAHNLFYFGANTLVERLELGTCVTTSKEMQQIFIIPKLYWTKLALILAEHIRLMSFAEWCHLNERSEDNTSTEI